MTLIHAIPRGNDSQLNEPSFNYCVPIVSRYVHHFPLIFFSSMRLSLVARNDVQFRDKLAPVRIAWRFFIFVRTTDRASLHNQTEI